MRPFNIHSTFYPNRWFVFLWLFCFPIFLKAQTYSRTFPTCTSSTANNDGKITLTTVTNADRYGIVTGSTYTGVAYASATTIGTLPIDIQMNIPNVGAVYTLRLFDGSDAVYKDTVISMAPRTCGTTCLTQSGTYQNIPMSIANNGLTFTADGGYMTDNNATGGNYANRLNRTVTICAPVGKVLLRFRMLDILAGDVLSIHDGSSTASPLLASFTNVDTILGVPQIESSGSCLTFHFTSDASGVAQGWEIEYSTGDLKIPTYFGVFSRVLDTFIQPNTSITILDNFTASGNAPVSNVFFDANKNIIKNDIGFCIDFPLHTATYVHSHYYGKITFTLDTLLPTDITKLQAARVTWLLKNAASLGYNITNPEDARTMQEGIWGILGQQNSPCNSACIAASTAVASEPVEPVINLTGCNTTAVGQSINYQLTTNSAKLVLRVSDGGSLPILCGTNPSGTTITDSILTIGGTGTRTVNLCLTRNTTTSISLRATDTLSLNSTQLTIYKPCDPSIQRFLSSQTLPHAYSEVCGTWVCYKPALLDTSLTICGSQTINLTSLVRDTSSYTNSYSAQFYYRYFNDNWTVLADSTMVSVTATDSFYVIKDPFACNPDTMKIKIVVNSVPSTPSVSSSVMNLCPATTVNLTNISAALTPSVSGGVFEWHTTNSPSSPLVNSPSAVGIDTYYLFEKSPSNCYSNSQDVQVQIQTCCPSPMCIPITITRNH